MAITKTTKIENITVFGDDKIAVAVATIVLDDGRQVSRKVEQLMFKPGDDISAQPDNVKAICNAAWQGKV